VAVALLLLACLPKAPAAESSREAKGETHFDFEGALEDWIALGGSGEAAHEEDITLSTEHARRGRSAVRFRVSPSSRVARGTRAELTFDAGQQEGETGRYAWSLLLPHDYPDVWMEDEEGAPNWQVMGQWHQQPDPGGGESWDRYPGRGESPPVAFTYYRLDEADPNYRALREDPRMPAVHGYDPAWRDESVLMLTYGTPPLPVAVRAISKGAWIEVEIEIHWSTRSDGWVEAWIDGEPLTEGRVQGPNMWNPHPHYLKLGLYRNPDIAVEQVVYYDSFSFEPVDDR
jgi:hypothetical protein